MDQDGLAFQAYDAMMKLLHSYFGAIYKGDRVAAIWTHLQPCRIAAEEYPRLTELARRKLEGVSGNLGQRLLDIYYQDVRPAGSTRIVYDLTEDYRYPIGNLHHALSILRTKGEAAFQSYADATGMPRNDRARVRHTATVRYPDIQIDDIARTGQAAQIGQTSIISTVKDHT